MSIEPTNRDQIARRNYPTAATNRVYQNFTELGDSFLLTQFREFYKEVIYVETMVKNGNWVYPIENAPAAARSMTDYLVINPNMDYTAATTGVWQRLLSLLEQQAMDANRNGGVYGVEFYKQAQYIMAALADEIFLNIDWEGQKAWMSNLLESRLFQTHVAGEMIFQKIDRILQERNPVYIDLASVYFMALSLGFRGKYRDVEDHGQIASYRRQLYAFIFHRKPDLLNESKNLFPDTYAHTLRDDNKQRHPNPRVWIGLCVIVFFVYIGVSHGLWLSLTSRLDQVNGRIQQIEKDLRKR